MKKLIAAIVNTHLWIAICASSMVLQTYFLLTGSWAVTPLTYLTFGSTLFLYAIHRLVGLQKLKDLKVSLNPRYIIIDRDHRIVLIFGVIGGLISANYFFQLQLMTQLWLVIPGTISIAYVIPFLSRKRRLRDIGLIKIFLIAIVYAMITVQLVFLEQNVVTNFSFWILFIEKALFIFAITIPFDIRDLSVDKISSVNTLPKWLGIGNAVRLSQASILACMVLVNINSLYTATGSIAMFFSYFLTLIFLHYSRTERPDLFYSFGLDGLMIFQTLMLFASYMA